MKKLLYIIPIILFFANCAKKMTFEQFRKDYPCKEIGREESTAIVTQKDTIYLSRKEFEATTPLPSKEVVSIEIGNDSLMIIRTKEVIEKTIKITQIDSAAIKGYQLTNKALEGRIKALETKEGDYILKIEKMKGSGRTTLIMAIIPWLILALLAFLCIKIVYIPNRIKK